MRDKTQSQKSTIASKYDALDERIFAEHFFRNVNYQFYLLNRAYPNKDWTTFYKDVPPGSLEILFPSFYEERREIRNAYQYIEVTLIILNKIPYDQRFFLWQELFLGNKVTPKRSCYSRSGLRYEKLKSYSTLSKIIRIDPEVHRIIDEMMEEWQKSSSSTEQNDFSVTM